MSNNDLYGVQTFVKGRKGKLEQGRFIECSDETEAQRLAERKVRNNDVAGAAAFLRKNYNAEFDDGSEPITIAVFGKVPPGVEDVIPF